jgi:hypothetical protein
LQANKVQELTDEQVENPRRTDFEAPARRSRLRWIVAGAGVFLIAALVLVLAGVHRQRPADAGWRRSAARVQVHAAGLDDASAGHANQQPGTMRLPGGGTAKLVRQELTDDGTLPIPQGLDEAAWWGATLGAEHGAALLSGHVNWKGKKGPFDELWRLKDGQNVEILDTAGGHWVYRVDEILTIGKDNLAERASALFGQDGPHRLVLITCGGDHVAGTEGYADTRIVSASLVLRP